MHPLHIPLEIFARGPMGIPTLLGCVVYLFSSTNLTTLQINDVFTDTQGFIARDDKKKEIVISLRGS
jgi:hypothetical protein